MKGLLILVFVLAASNAESYNDSWTEFKLVYGKNYKSIAEETSRYALFKSTFDRIQNHNIRYKKGEVSYFLRINKFADLTDEEYETTYSRYEKPDIEYENTFKLNKNAVVPESIDWKQKGAVLPVQDQGYCGSCYAFSALGALEGLNFIKHNVSQALSEQEIIDCSTENRGCLGGNMIHVYAYMRKNGISTYSSYPYQEKKVQCRNGTDSGIKITGYTAVPQTEEALKQAIATVGPISTGINSGGLRYYGGGIFDYPHCSKKLDHGVLVVGYSTEKSKDYWLIKNSWGQDWGENGYFRLARNKGQQCGISLDSSYPEVV